MVTYSTRFVRRSLSSVAAALGTCCDNPCAFVPDRMNLVLPPQRQHARSGGVPLPSHPRAEHVMGMPETLERWTAERVRELPDDGKRYEVVDGELLVTPAPASRISAPSPSHSSHSEHTSSGSGWVRSSSPQWISNLTPCLPQCLPVSACRCSQMRQASANAGAQNEGSAQDPSSFQSAALPTELPGRNRRGKIETRRRDAK